MVLERRFLIASPLARLIQRDRGSAKQLVEAHFPSRLNRSPLVRVEHGKAWLVLRSSTENGQTSDDQVEVPLPHAESLLEVAAGTVAFDRTPLPVRSNVEVVLDRFIIPNGLDLLTVTISIGPHEFTPPIWFGEEVTGDSAYTTGGLALNGSPIFKEPEVSNAAVDALVDVLEGWPR